MKQANNYVAKALFILMAILPLQQVFAQDKVEVNGHDVGYWFETHWVWVAGAILFLIILLLLASSSRKRRSTTITRDPAGHVQSITTIEKKD